MQQPPVQEEQPVQQPQQQIVAGVSDEDEAESAAQPPRQQAVAGASDETEQVRPQAVLAATGAEDVFSWLLLTLAMLLLAIGAGIRATQLRR